MLKKSLTALTLSFCFSLVSFAEEEVFSENCALASGTDFAAEFVGARNPQFVESGEEFGVKFYFKNTGDAVWRNEKSECAGAKVYLSPSKPHYRYSEFYQEGLEGWQNSSRIVMEDLEILPGEIATFNFRAQSFGEARAMREYFTVTTNDTQSLDEGTGYFDVVIGEPAISEENYSLTKHLINESGDYENVDLSGNKILHVDISDQWLQVKVGDTVLNEMPISTGAIDTPTPYGTHTVIGKNPVRIANKDPNWIMPRFLMLNTNYNPEADPATQLGGFEGYGFHALPSLGTDALRAEIRGYLARGEVVPTSLYETDTFWRESWSHIGSRVSHGCIRLKPDDADWLYEFVKEEDFGAIKVEVVP